MPFKKRTYTHSQARIENSEENACERKRDRTKEREQEKKGKEVNTEKF